MIGVALDRVPTAPELVLPASEDLEALATDLRRHVDRWGGLVLSREEALRLSAELRFVAWKARHAETAIPPALARLVAQARRFGRRLGLA